MSSNSKLFYSDKNNSDRNSPPFATQSGMYSRDKSQEHSSDHRLSPMGRIPRRSHSDNELRSELNQISNDLNWNKMRHEVKDTIEKRVKRPNSNANGFVFYPPPHRKKRKEDIPLKISGHIIPSKDALTLELVFNNKTTLESQLEANKNTVIGLDFMTEYVDPDNECPRVYHCRLCKQFNSCSSVMEHLCGYNHRVRYILLKYPSKANIYLMPNRRHANRNSALMTMAHMEVKELETVYGRGVFEVKHERPTIPKETQFDKESNLFLQCGQQTEVLKNALQMIRDCKVECDQDLRIATKIINDLTDAIFVYKESIECNDLLKK